MVQSQTVGSVAAGPSAELLTRVAELRRRRRRQSWQMWAGRFAIAIAGIWLALLLLGTLPQSI
jgi:hypothetical protein